MTKQTAATAMTSATARTAWDELPGPVRDAVRSRVGEVRHVDVINSGLNASFTACLRTTSGRVFAKGAHSDRAAALRREAATNPYLETVAPALRWQVDTDGWYLLGFEYLDGHSADLTPASADLTRVADLLGHVAELEPPAAGCRRIADRWAEPAGQADVDPGLLAGNQLLHTDLNPHNILITKSGARLVDWAWPALGAAWIDTACTALWLIAEGHTPNQAEAWAATVPTWTDASDAAIDAFTAINRVLWEQIAHDEPRSWKQQLHSAANAWSLYRRA